MKKNLKNRKNNKLENILTCPSRMLPGRLKLPIAVQGICEYNQAL